MTEPVKGVGDMGTKDVCSRCLRGQHDQCTAGESCGCLTCNPPLLVWEDPPPLNAKRMNIMTPERVTELRANPKRWARIHEYKSKGGAHTFANAVKRGRIAQLQPEEWEFTGRTNGTGGSILYARFIGKAVKAVAEAQG